MGSHQLASDETAVASRNRLLKLLQPGARDFVDEHALRKPMTVGEILYEEGSPLIHVVFPHNGVVSLQTTLKDGRLVETASIGLEGFLGLDFLAGATHFPCRAVVTVEGHASWFSTADFALAMDKFPCFRGVMLGYSVSIIRRLMQTVACATVHPSAQRVATWLLHADDRTMGSSFSLTQRTLATALGLRLATVNDAMSQLQARKSLNCSRGTIAVVDRRQLEREACECYEATRMAAE